MVQDFSKPQNAAMSRTVNPRHNYDVQEMPGAMPYVQTVSDEQLGFDDMPMNESINFGDRNEYE